MFILLDETDNDNSAVAVYRLLRRFSVDWRFKAMA